MSHLPFHPSPLTRVIKRQTTIRMLMSIGGLVPLPSDALVTPVTFRVKKRNLSGILAEFDATEDGTRELSGEWVVSKKTWQKLQAEWRATRKSPSPEEQVANEVLKTKEQVILYIHGGSALDYRLAPESRFPGPLHDVVSGFLRLVEDLHIPPENILLAGDSAGGGLCLALLIFDVVPFPQDDHMNPVALYLGERIEEYLTHPYASPLFGDFGGLPPLLIQVGDAEVLRDESTLLAHKATLAGVDVRHELFEDAIHVFQSYPFLPATRRAFSSMGSFVRNILPHLRSRSPQPLDPNVKHHLEEEIENEKSTIVGGDGVETKTGLDRVKNQLTENANSYPQCRDESLPDSKEYSSWGRSSRLWPLVTMPTPYVEEDDCQVTVTRPPSPAAARHPHTMTSEKTDGPRRSRSAVSLLALPISQPVVSRHRHHKSSFESRRVGPGYIRMPMMAMSKCSTPPPSPLESPSYCCNNSSHPDIASLVEDWSHSGPANQTMRYAADSRNY
ncbi:hypothetical protein H0H87_010476 [Tephrocybe sp. NHM501043]|nr:hypothetical protein H0H87_010476 [Tephrocybe sp. NHM501043]